MSDKQLKMIPESFCLEKEQTLTDFAGTVSLYHHKNGLRVVNFDVPDDVTNIFAIAFRTPGKESTGVQHIIEHSVLAGSRHYSVKSPFDTLMKTSLATYINAYTSPLYTAYPFASFNKADFFNGVGVYLDAVFNPLLEREAFLQEGWHYEYSGDDADGKRELLASGIVLNEMRATQFSASYVSYYRTLRELFPNSPFAVSSGGDPAEIVTLSYEDYVAFYRRHYRFSNALVYFWGNCPVEEKLKFLDDFISEKCQDRANEEPYVDDYTEDWEELSASKCVTDYSELVPGKAKDKANCLWQMSWRWDKPMDVEERLSLTVLIKLLDDDDGSPLRRAVLDSGLCSNYSGIFFQPLSPSHQILSMVCDSVKKKSFDALREVCLSKLASCAEEGFSAEHIQAVVNETLLAMERTHERQMGLTVMKICLCLCLFGNMDFDGLFKKSTLKKVRERFQSGKSYISELLHKYFLDNHERVEMRVLPDKAAVDKKREADAAKIRELGELALATRGQAAIEADCEALQKYVQRKDTPEMLASFPKLKRADLPLKPTSLPVHWVQLANGTKLYRGRSSGSNVNHLILMYDASIFNEEELRLLPRFVSLWDDVGIIGCKYDEFERRMSLAGAEIYESFALTNRFNTWKPLLRLELSLDGVAEYWKDALNCLKDKCTKADFSDIWRIRESLNQDWGYKHTEWQMEGISIMQAMSLKKDLCALARCEESLNGLSEAYVLADTIRHAKGTRYKEVIRIFQGMMTKISQIAPEYAAYVGDDAGYRLVRAYFEGADARPACTIKELTWNAAADYSISRNAKQWFKTDSTEYSCVAVLDVLGHCKLSTRQKFAISMYCDLLMNNYLLPTIRQAGGAYVVHAVFDFLAGFVLMCSGRDRKPLESLEAFKNAMGYWGNWTEEDVEGIAVSMGNVDKPRTPIKNAKYKIISKIRKDASWNTKTRRKAMLDVRLADVRWAANLLGRLMKKNGLHLSVAGADCGWAEKGFEEIIFPQLKDKE